MPHSPDPATVGGEIEQLVQKMAALADAPERAEAQELVRLLMSLYGAGLTRMLDVIRTESGGPQAVLDRLANDGLVASLLVLHDLHPHPTDRRVMKAMAGLTPHLPSHLAFSAVEVYGDRVRVH